MLAYVYESKGVLRLTDRPVPEMPAGGAVMRVEAASICGTDVRAHRFGSDKIDAGRIIGHESAGILVSCDAPGFHLGDRIAVAPAIGCGVCRHCLAGRTNMCDDLHTIGFQYDGAFAEFLAIPAQAFRMGNVNAIPSGVDAGPYPPAEPLACVINAQSFLRIGPDDVVLIFGAGYIGCMHAWLARLAGAAHVIIAETAEGRIHEVRRLLDEMSGVQGLVAALLYGTGMRLMEGLRLRVKDVEFERREIVVRREGKWNEEVAHGCLKPEPVHAQRPVEQ